jgi:hypothetical protein
MDEYGDVEAADIIEEEYDLYEDELDAEVEEENEETDEDVADEFQEESIDTIPDNIIQLDKFDKNYRIIRIIADEDRITSDIIQLPEYTEAIGQRASAIEQGSPVLTDVSGLSSPIDQAKKEFFDRHSPLILQRIIKKTPEYYVVERWQIRSMIFPVVNRKIPLTTKQIDEFTK